MSTLAALSCLYQFNHTWLWLQIVPCYMAIDVIKAFKMIQIRICI